jgi:hypothetical protein
MATLQGKAVKNTYRQVLQIGANNVGVSGSLQPVQDGGGVNTSLSLSTNAATITGTLTINGDLIITGGGIQIQDLIDDTVASLIQNGTGITWAYNDTLRTLTPTITIATADGGVQGDFVQYNTGAGEANAVAKMYWNTTDGTVDLGLMGGNVVLPIGQKQVARVLNNSGSILNKSAYQVVKITAAQGQRLAVGLAQANNDANSTDTIGLVAENIANNQEGFVTSSGLITGVDTTGDLQLEDWNDGDILYLSPTTPGAITKVKPVAPQHTVIVGFVVYAHKNNGKIYVKVDNGYELDELHNVKITNVENNNVIKYNSSLAVWENVAPITTWIAEGTNLYYTQGRFDSAFAAKSTTNLAEGTNLYFTTARGDVNFAANFATKTTTNLPEGTNLYFTNQRFDSRFGTKTTTDLTEGTNLYYTQARFNTAFDAKTTTDLDEGTNLYYTDARARLALSSSATGLSYANNSGVFSLTAGYAIPTSVKLGEYDIAYNRSIVSAAVTGTSTKTLSLTQQDANVITATWTDQGITTINGTANQIAATTVGNTTTLAFTNDVTMPNNLVVSGNLTINGTATYVNTQSISAKDPLFEVANDNNTTDAVDIGYYGRYFDAAQTRVEFTGLFRDASDAGKFKFFTGLTVEPTNVVDTTGTGYTVGTLVANLEGNLAGTANAANVLSTARTISATGDAAWSVSFDGSSNATGALTLANTGVTATTYGTTTAVPTIAVDSKGRITSASNTNIAFPVTTVNGQAGTVVLTTSNVAEGSNQYFTTARAQASITGGASSVVTADLTASRVLVSDGSGKIAASASITTTDLGYLSGVTSAIQTQLDSKLNLSGGTLTGGLSGTTGSFSGILTTPQVKAATSAGLSINANSGTQVANFGAGGGANITLYGGLTGTSASFSGNVVAVNGTLVGGSGTVNSIPKFTAANTLGDSLFSDNGTNGSFGGANYTAGTGVRSFNITAPQFAGLGFYTGSTYTADIFAYETSGNLLIAADPTNILTNSNLLFAVDGTTRLTIASTGAATFSSTVSTSKIIAPSATFSLNTTDGGFKVTAVAATPSTLSYLANNYFAKFFTRTDQNYGITIFDQSEATAIQSADLVNGNNAKALILNPYGGNVGIGTSSPLAATEIRVNTNDYGNNLLLTNNFPNNEIATSLSFGHNTAAADADIMARISGYVDDRTSGNRKGSLRFYTGSGGSITERARITSDGAVLAGATSLPSASVSGVALQNPRTLGATLFSVGNVTDGRTMVQFLNGNGVVGSIVTTGSTTVYNVTSDYRLKQDLKEYNGLELVGAIKTYDYEWKSDNTRMYGVMAHELQEVLPYAVHGEKDGEEMQSVDYSKIVPLLVKSIQELKAEIDELKAK